ncbi:hypothetical protein Tco_0893079 [Tanacetum coccineum]|uniref:Uncharacterized protein n=1 Tax=Tanacetum coccineum TaxID=301880 RepID=A0ABQ5CAN2_9ASTR
MESNKSNHRSNEQKNLYKVLVDAYESDKLIVDTYEDTVSFKRHRDDEDKDEEPSAGSNRRVQILTQDCWRNIAHTEGGLCNTTKNLEEPRTSGVIKQECTEDT